MCIFNDECKNIKFSEFEDCYNCCCNYIRDNKLLDERQKQCWQQLLYKYKSCTETPSFDDNTFTIISYYVATPSIFLNSFREILLEFFKKKGINVDLLKQGKWLPLNLNISIKLIEHILITQKIEDIFLDDYKESMEFFIKENSELHRNKVAHDIIATLDSVKHINQFECFKHFLNITHFVLSLSYKVENFSI